VVRRVNPESLSIASIPALIVWTYVAMSGMTLIAYAADKRAARFNRIRTRERTLHLLEILGGWPGALIGQQLFRHKRRKPSFFLVTWLVAIAHVAGWMRWLNH